MKPSFRGTFVAAALLASTIVASAALAQQTTSAKSDQWIHVRVESKDDGGETVRVNVPVEMAVKVLPAIKHEPLHDGKVHIHDTHMNDVDLHALLDAVRSSKDGEYVTIQGRDGDEVRVAKSAGYLYVHVTEKKHEGKEPNAAEGKEAHGKHARDSKVEVKVPMKVVDALLSAGKDELDIVAALHALASSGDTELVTVKDADNTVRVWIDSKNISE